MDSQICQGRDKSKKVKKYVRRTNSRRSEARWAEAANGWTDPRKVRGKRIPNKEHKVSQFFD
jgi:hypothetical protein